MRAVRPVAVLLLELRGRLAGHAAARCRPVDVTRTANAGMSDGVAAGSVTSDTRPRWTPWTAGEGLHTSRDRSWDVLLIGGASGTGKSTVANELARRFAVPVTPIDDIVTALMTLSTPEQQPILHRFWTEPGAFDWPAERIVDHTIEVVRVLTPGINAVIDDHLASVAPVILEGDYLSPGSRPGR